MLRKAGVVAAAMLSWAGMAQAQDEMSGDGGRFDLAFGLDVLSNYIDQGVTKTDHGPAVQGWVEPGFGILYGSLWASNVSLGGVADAEIVLGAGIRPEVGPVEFDLGYRYVFYLNGVDDPEHELRAAAEWEILEWLALEPEFEWEPLSGDWSAEGEVTVSLPRGFAVFGGAGYAGTADDDEVSYLYYKAGLSWSYRDRVTLALEYHGSGLDAADCAANGNAATACGHAFLARLSLATGLGDLRVGGEAGADGD